MMGRQMLSRIQSLKANIAVQLGFFFLFVIVLSDLTVISLVEKKLVKAAVADARIRLINFVEMPVLSKSFNGKIGLLSSGRMARAIYTELPAEDGRTFVSGRLDPRISEKLYTFKARVVLQKKGGVTFAGREWGVFWPQERYAIIAVFSPSGRPALAVLDFSIMYETLRSSQKPAFWFLGLNFIVFLLLAAFRITRLVTRPVQRYVRITESFADSEHFDFFPEKRNDEFSRLSVALNRMLLRIREDTARLKESLSRLEQANRELKETRDEMIRTEKLASVGRLSAGIAHEIGNPIGIVLGYLGLLKDRLKGTSDEETLDFLERSESEINRINRIIRRLLDFSRSLPEPIIKPVSIHALIKDIGEFAAGQPLFSGIRVSYDLNAESDRVLADYDQLYQVLMNLVINAVDAVNMAGLKDEGEICFATNIVQDKPKDEKNRAMALRKIEILVSDNGIGISAGDMDKVFDPFFSTKAPGKGTGLGLSVSYMIIERFGGSMNVESSPGRGTTMRIRLPVMEDGQSG